MRSKAGAVDPWMDQREVRIFNRVDELTRILDFHHPESRPHGFTIGFEHLAEPVQSHESKRSPGRWKVERIGERAEILWPVRRGVALRDDFTCRICHTDMPNQSEIDHVIPWSSGGSDKSTNLRFTCAPCNQARGNRITQDERIMRPVTWWCVDCWTSPDQWRDGYVRRDMGTHVELTKWLSIAHRVDPETASVNAYCANCRHVSRTDVTL